MSFFKKSIKKISLIFILIIMFFMIQIPTVGETFWENENTQKYNALSHYLFVLVSFLLVSIPLFLIYTKINKTAIFKTSFSKRDLFWIILFTFTSISGQNIVEYLMTGTISDAGSRALLNTEKTTLFPLFIIVILLLSPILEELLFRGILQGGLLKRWPPIFKILVTGVIFGMAHSFLQPLSFESLSLMTSGISFSACYYFTDNNLESSVIVHSLSNLWVLIFYMFN